MADFNGDGRPDLAADCGNNTVAVFLGAHFSGLTIAPTHVGDFVAGQAGSYQIVITNPAFVTTSGTVTVTDTLPAGLTATAMSGTGWTCTLATLTCTRSDALGNDASYPAITIAVNVSGSLAASTITNQASVANGSFMNAATDPTVIVIPPAVYIDSPVAGSTVGGTITITGWAIDNASFAGVGIASVLVLVDGTAVGNATYGVNRPDVCAVYPGRPGCPYVGYTYQLNTGLLTLGQHTISVSATDMDTPTETTVASVPVTVVAALAAPTGLTATAGISQVTLAWTASSGATSYNVYRGATAGGESATPLVTGIAGTSYTDTGLTNGTPYYYAVAAVNAGGTSPLSAEAFAKPAGQLADAVFRNAAGAIELSSYASSALSNSGGVFASDPSAALDLAGDTFVAARAALAAIL